MFGAKSKVESSLKRKRPSKSDVQTLLHFLEGRVSILVICLSRSFGGLEKIAASDALDVGALGLQVSFLCYEGSPLHRHLEGRKEVKLFPIDFKPRDFFDFKLRNEINRLIHGEQVNLIHTHQTTLLGSLIPWVVRNPNIVIIASRHLMNRHWKRNPFHAFLYRRLDSLVVMSETLKQNVLETHFLKERQLKVIAHGIDFEVFDPHRIQRDILRKQWGADDQTVVLGVVGRIDPDKGQGVFLKAVAGLEDQMKNQYKLKYVIVGEPTLDRKSTYMEELQQLIEQLHIKENVVFTGFLENIAEVMGALDIFVMPSREEAFGLVAIEAMAMERPVVISNAGSAKEIVRNEQFGLLFRPMDAFDLRRKLIQLLSDPAKRIEMGKKARHYVMETYNRQMRVQKTLELYERCLRRRGL